MRRVFWVRGQRRFYGVCWLLFLILSLPIINLVSVLSGEFNLVEMGIFDGICAVLVVTIALEVFVQRVIVEQWGIQAYDMLNRAKPPLPYDQITTYGRTQTGDWILMQGETVYRIPRIDKQQFHSVIAEFAPKALHAKLWKCGQLPPSENYERLSAFDASLWLNSLVGAMVVSGILSLFARMFAVFYFASSCLQVSYELRNLVGKISLTEQGIGLRYPWSTTFIAWNEITAVFCEQSAGRFASFVVTAVGGRSIIIPSHILADPEVRRKFFYNIPDRTRCVNFDKMRFRRGRGKKIYAGDESVGYSLEPQLG